MVVSNNAMPLTPSNEGCVYYTSKRSSSVSYMLPVSVKKSVIGTCARVD